MNKEHLHPDGRPYTKEEFVEKIKTDKTFAKRFGNLGKIYGYQWRNWDGNIDQISDLIKQLKENPDSRRLLLSTWNASDLPHQVLPTCHYGFQVYTRALSDAERLWICSQRHHIRFGTNDGQTWYSPDNPDRDKLKWMTEDQRQLCDFKNIPTRAISLMWNQRSVDTPLGLPFNIASYAILLELLGKIVNMVPDELIANLGDTHIYLNQIDGIKEQLKRESFELPTLRINTEFWPTKSGECGVGELTDNIDFLIKEMRIDDFQIENYKSHPPIKMPLSN